MMSKFLRLGRVAAATTVLVAAPAWAQTSHGTKPNSCFYMTQFRSWSAPDDKTIYIRVNVSDIYRLDTAQTCPELRYPAAHLVTRTRGPQTVCTALDWDLSVADGTGPGSFAVPCIVKTMTRLSPEEAVAIPKKDRPS